MVSSTLSVKDIILKTPELKKLAYLSQIDQRKILHYYLRYANEYFLEDVKVLLIDP